MKTPEADTDPRTLRRRLRWISALAVALACAVAGLVGNLVARERPRAPAPSVAVPQSPTVRPSDPAGARHPTFDCRGFTGPLDGLSGDTGRAIAALDTIPAGQRVRTRGKVMAAYPRIRGVNWLHLCDAPGGAVLVVATADWAHPGDDVIVEGTLARDRDIGGVYVFPLLIEGGRLEGPGVIEQGTMRGDAIDL